MCVKILILLLSSAVVKADINQVSILKYKNYTIPNIDYICSNYKLTENISEKCGEQLQVVCEDVDLFSTMLDATSTFPYTGLNYASRSDYGNFDQCMTVAHNHVGGKILGKHCTAGLLIADISSNMSDFNSFYQLSVCKPDACSAEDYTVITSNLMEGLPLIFQDSMCQTIESSREITALDIITIIIFATVILLMIISTIYNVYLYKTQSDCPHPLYLAFSVLSNGKKLLQVSKNSKEQIQPFHGLRAIGMMWIVAGHGFGLWRVIPITNVEDTVKWMNSRYSGYITTGPLSVDTFFFISGFLLAFQYLKQEAKPLKKQLVSVPQMYLYRYLRLTPAMLMVFLLTASIIKYFGSGPLWTPAVERSANICKEKWWPFFLYIQNYFADNAEEMCLPHTWYLSADMQMFLLSPLVLIPLSLNLRKPSGFMMCMAGLLILNLIFVALPMSLQFVNREYNHGNHPNSRFINYFIGMMLAVFMRMKQEKQFLYMVKSTHKTTINVLIWAVTLLGMLTILICYQEVLTHYGYESKAVFNSLMRPAWCIGLSWIVYSCHHGYGGFVNWILSVPLMEVLGRLTYCIYLIHLPVLRLHQMSIRSKLYFSDYMAFYNWCGHFIVSTLLAIFWTLAFESPLIIIEKHFLGSRQVQSKESQALRENTETKRENEPTTK